MASTLIMRSCAAAAGLLLAACGGGGGGSGTTTGGGYDWSALASTLDSYVGSGSGQVSGYSFALKIGGQTVYTRAGGDLSTSSVVAIASASKAPAATVILSLVKDGLINLDTPVANYLGSAITWPADKSAITMRMLLNHTSGIPFDSPCLSDTSTTLQACAQEIANTDLNFTPGTRFGYSGAGYQIAGYVAQRVSNTVWGTLVEQRLTTPLAMSSYTYGATQNPRVAGGASSNAADYLKFTQLYLDGGSSGGTTIITGAQVSTAQNSQIAGLPVYYSPAPSGSGLNGYSFGLWITDAAQRAGSPGPELSDPGLLGTTPWLDFGESYTAIILIDSTTATGVNMWTAVRPEILAQIAAQKQQ